MSRNVTENKLRGWNPVDNVLDRFNLSEDATLVVRSSDWLTERQLKETIESCFTLMREKGRVVLEVLPSCGKHVFPYTFPRLHAIEND